MLRIFFVSLALSLIADVTCLAQSNFATLSGSVTDTQAAPLRGAHVEVTSNETHAVRQVTVNEAGLYDVPNLLPGTYRVEVRASGFEELSKTVLLEVGQEMRLDLQLAIGQKLETVDVSARTEMLKTSDASLVDVVETKSIQELPLNGRMFARSPGHRAWLACRSRSPGRRHESSCIGVPDSHPLLASEAIGRTRTTS
jgi:hypothetical protein